MLSHEGFMRAAIAAARRGAAAGEVPVGAVIVIDGEIVATAHNEPISQSDATAHAELLAIREAGRKTGKARRSKNLRRFSQRRSMRDSLPRAYPPARDLPCRHAAADPRWLST